MNDQKGLVRYVVQHDRARAVVMVLLLALAGVFEGIGFAAALPILESLVSGDTESSNAVASAVSSALLAVGIAPTLGVLLLLLSLIFLLKAVVSYFASLTAGVMVAEVVTELRLRLLRAITQAEWRHVLAYPTGFISNAISNEAGRAGSAYQEFARLVSDGMQVTVYLILVFLISWQTGLAAMGVGAIILLMLQGRVRATNRAGYSQVQILRAILARLTDTLPSLKPLKAMGKEGYMLPHLEEQTRAYFEAYRRQIASQELLMKAREPAVMAALAGGLWVVLTLTTLTPTMIMILAVLFYRSVNSMTNMQQRWVSVLVGDNSFRSLMEHVDAAEAAREDWVSEGKPLPALKQELRLENVSFAYGTHRVLEGAVGTLKAGQFVALVGPSGSGKTTLTDLVTGLLRPTGGRILVDGEDMSDVDMREWRRRIGYVPQEPMLFSDSLRANITLGNRDLSDEEVKEALRNAGALQFVMALEGGLDHRIGEGGTSLSGGQRQRLSIARALITRPSLLILDEPTTSLDSLSEEEVCRAIEGLKGEQTILAISHQPALRRLADVTWDLQDGRIRVLPGHSSIAVGA